MKKASLITGFTFGTAVVALSAASGMAVASDNPFAAQPLQSGYQLAEEDSKTREGKCGEAKCGANKQGTKQAEGKCGAKKAEGQCGAKGGASKKTEGKCGEAKCGANK